MNKWFWQISLAFFILAALLAVAGWMTMPDYSLDSSVLSPKTSSDKVTDASENQSGDHESDSPLVIAAREFSRRLGPPIGNLIVKIEPAEVIEAGAMWGISSNNWHASGEKLENVKGAKYGLILKPVADWQTPAGISVEIKRDETAELTVTYERIKYGDGLVRILPQEVVTAGAQWQVNNQGWKDSGQAVNKLVVGEFPVQFKPVEGWRPPKASKIKIEEEKVTELEAVYEKIEYGSVQIAIEPNSIALTEVKWRVKGKNWGNEALIEKLEVGNYDIEFQGNDDWEAPAVQKVEVQKDSVAEVKGVFTRIPKGTIVVSILPDDKRLAGAQWQVDNGPWQNSGIELAVRTGKHTVKYKAVAGWGLPDSQNIEIEDQKQVTLAGNYILQKPPGPKFTVTMTIVAADGKGLAYIKMPTDKSDKLYLAGEKVGDYILERIKNGSVILIKDGFDYELEIPKPDPSRKVVSEPEPAETQPSKNLPPSLTGPGKPNLNGSDRPAGIPSYTPGGRLPYRPPTNNPQRDGANQNQE